ncbi:hypothetical protein I7I50_04217 [Histoplasma capsulatum G186AR]|uniref:Uncharacterized protein n=1 Tax=Ajellomyces capsulatus TaxID=5037 RepID=A0A8H8CXU8_AJECA|nr:hypothetical protein I7I52_05125 [Histoplasma capsulatum]QSS75169.1 hypothetical protein I7I50_04217 [Histoplasma capsulatum G186AR]
MTQSKVCCYVLKSSYRRRETCTTILWLNMTHLISFFFLPFFLSFCYFYCSRNSQVIFPLAISCYLHRSKSGLCFLNSESHKQLCSYNQIIKEQNRPSHVEKDGMEAIRSAATQTTAK